MSLNMGMITRSQASGFSTGKASCPSCKTPLDEPLGNHLGHGSRPSTVKIILKVRATCRTCKVAFEQLLLRKTRSNWTKKSFQKLADNISSATINRIVRTKKYTIKFHQGTTLKLRNGAKASILRVPNRWTRVN